MLDLWDGYTTRHFGRAAKALNSLKKWKQKRSWVRVPQVPPFLFYPYLIKKFANLL